MTRREVVIVGKCRVCGCTDLAPCVDEETGLTCVWVDAEHTLCDFIQCIAVVPICELERMVAPD